MTVVGALAVRDEQAARAALKHLGEEIKREQKGTVLTPGKLSVPVDGAVLKVEVRKDVVLFGVGRSADLDKKLAAFGKDQVLASDPAFAGQRKGGHATSHGFAFVDYGAMKTLDPTFAEATKLQALATWVDLGLAPDPNGLAVTLEAQGFAAILGTTAALAVASVQRYLQSAKTAEAKVSVSAIARSAVMAFERESVSGPTHKLCRSATAVPAQVPQGTTYRPVAEPNRDFQTGSDSEGWRCLRFDMTEPVRFRYEYRAGSGYKGPARGGPNPGPNGFEVSAEGDLDGDGKTSLFTLVGKPGPGGTIQLSKELFVADELE
jgi:type II secretory pathway pseudopilin PulG